MSASGSLLASLLADQHARRPLLEVQDLYKLLFQAAMGCEHAAPDPEFARAGLERELAGVGAGPDDPLFETLPPDGRMVRVNLRPYLAAGGARDDLLAAFLRTAREAPASTQALRAVLGETLSLAEQGWIPFPPDALASFFHGMESQGFPAVHHSPAYRRLYRPSYRVVVRTFLEEA